MVAERFLSRHIVTAIFALNVNCVNPHVAKDWRVRVTCMVWVVGSKGHMLTLTCLHEVQALARPLRKLGPELEDDKPGVREGPP